MKIHILAIGGTMTTPLALALKNDGHTVTGSDQKYIYPPFSQNLYHAHIPINPKLNSFSPDLVIVGSAFKKFSHTQTEFEFFKNKKTPYISATKYIADNLIKSNSILVAGSYGKTTITAALSWILTKIGFNPSYFFGGQSKNRFPSLRFSSSDWSVVEADESKNGLDTQAKFLYYPVKYLILTSSRWEHHDSYKSKTENQESFIKLIKRLTPDGLLVYNAQDPSTKSLIKYAQCKSIDYSLYTSKHPFLFGQHNQNNLAACVILCLNLGISPQKTDFYLQKFKGIKRRLELISTIKNTYFYDDFGQNPIRIDACLSALADKFPNQRILVILEPHASFLQYPNSLKGLGSALKKASKVFLGKIQYSQNKNTRTSFSDYQKLLGDKLIYLPLYPDLQNSVLSSLNPGDVLVHFSSGGLSGLKTFKQIINKFKYQALEIRN
mgnify:CR=1 FL=1